MLAKTPINDILFDKDTIIGFLESKDPNEKYDYYDSNKCAFANFLIVHGVDPSEFYAKRRNGRRDCIPPGIWQGILNSLPKEWTYGHALARAKELFK